MKIGDAVIYVDERGSKHNAVVTQVWGNSIEVPVTKEYMIALGHSEYEHPNNINIFVVQHPLVNLLYVNADEKFTDQYGRQIVRVSSVSHIGLTNPPGRYYITP